MRIHKFISSAVICAFLFNDIAYANPYTLSKEIYNPEIIARLKQEMTKRLDAKLDLPQEPNVAADADAYTKAKAYLGYFNDLLKCIGNTARIEVVVIEGDERYTDFLDQWLRHVFTNEWYALKMFIDAYEEEAKTRKIDKKDIDNLSRAFVDLKTEFGIIKGIAASDRAEFANLSVPAGTDADPVPRSVMTNYFKRRLFVDDKNADHNWAVFRECVRKMDESLAKLDAAIQEIIAVAGVPAPQPPKPNAAAAADGLSDAERAFSVKPAVRLEQCETDIKTLNYEVGHYRNDLAGLLEAKIISCREDKRNVRFVGIVEPKLSALKHSKIWARLEEPGALKITLDTYQNGIVPWIDEVLAMLESCESEYRENFRQILNGTKEMINGALIPALKYWIDKPQAAAPAPATGDERRMADDAANMAKVISKAWAEMKSTIKQQLNVFLDLSDKGAKEPWTLEDARQYNNTMSEIHRLVGDFRKELYNRHPHNEFWRMIGSTIDWAVCQHVVKIGLCAQEMLDGETWKPEWQESINNLRRSFLIVDDYLSHATEIRISKSALSENADIFIPGAMNNMPEEKYPFVLTGFDKTVVKTAVPGIEGRVEKGWAASDSSQAADGTPELSGVSPESPESAEFIIKSSYVDRLRSDNAGNSRVVMGSKIKIKGEVLGRAIIITGTVENLIAFLKGIATLTEDAGFDGEIPTSYAIRFSLMRTYEEFRGRAGATKDIMLEGEQFDIATINRFNFWIDKTGRPFLSYTNNGDNNPETDRLIRVFEMVVGARDNDRPMQILLAALNCASGLRTNISEALRYRGVYTLEQLMEMDANELRAWRNGERILSLVLTACKKLDLGNTNFVITSEEFEAPAPGRSDAQQQAQTTPDEGPSKPPEQMNPSPLLGTAISDAERVFGVKPAFRLEQCKADIKTLSYEVGHYRNSFAGLLEAKIISLREDNRNIKFVEMLEPKLSDLMQFEIWARLEKPGALKITLDTYENRIIPWIDEVLAMLKSCAPEYRESFRRTLNGTKDMITGALIPALEYWIINRDIENGLNMLDETIPDREKQDGVKYYTVRYDISRIPRGSPAEEALKVCVNQLMNFKLRGEDRIKLIASGETNKGLIWVGCYKDRARSDGQKTGEGRVDVARADDGNAFRIVGMVNMALAASENDIDFVKRQYRDMAGEAPSYSALWNIGNGIWRITLPHAEKVPSADEYYELTVKKLREAA